MVIFRPADQVPIRAALGLGSGVVLTRLGKHGEHHEVDMNFGLSGHCFKLLVAGAWDAEGAPDPRCWFRFCSGRTLVRPALYTCFSEQGENYCVGADPALLGQRAELRIASEGNTQCVLDATVFRTAYTPSFRFRGPERR